MIGGAGRLARGDVPPRCLHQGRWPQRSTAVPWPRRSARYPEENGITNFYWQYFQHPRAEAELERDVAATMQIVLGGRGFSDPSAHLFIQEGKGFADADPHRPLPGWLTEADIATFAEIYRKSGFRGGLNWYRNIDRNWELTASAGRKATSAVIVHCGIEGWRDYRPDWRQAGQGDGARAAESEAKAHSRRPATGSAERPGRGQCRPDYLPEGVSFL